MKKPEFLVLPFILLFIFASSITAQQLVYKPKNPAFGGDTFNHQWLMSDATAQNGFTDDGAGYEPYSRDPLVDFQESLNRQILSQLSRQLVGDTFGEDEFKEGRYELGNYVIDITEGLEGVNIYILDSSTGNETTVVVPYL